ncbi:DUF4189 domain-containing protein [Thermomonas fusca]|uniref:DUF4189 domain-containing protein n=2 Tax=Thermomonas fusca TaxID=215690 RepID=A0A5R9PBK3_9GAMM|nr:DUF4189 domain-containing protein [Thermomonas fusca]
MNKSQDKLFLKIVFLFFFCAASFAQAPPPGRGPCPVGAPVNGSCGSPSNQGHSTPPAEYWQDRFGAMAVSPRGELIVIEGQRSARRAKRLVLDDCGKDCILLMEVRNACQVLLKAPLGDVAAGGGTISVAIDKARAQCTAAGNPTCETIFYQGCSLPVRIH